MFLRVLTILVLLVVQLVAAAHRLLKLPATDLLLLLPRYPRVAVTTGQFRQVYRFLLDANQRLASTALFCLRDPVI